MFRSLKRAAQSVLTPTSCQARRAYSPLGAVLLGFSALLSSTAYAQQTAPNTVLNLYSARHYNTDIALYENFTKATGIRINRIEASDEPLLERLRTEGKSSPADVLLLVDAARLWRAQIDGFFSPVSSKILDARVPPELRGGSEWFGISTRARVLVYNKDRINPGLIQNYQDLARPELKGQVCTRSGSHPYMLSWIGSMIEHLGEVKATEWARGVVGNMARPPRGGDTDQIRAVASGECGVAVSNTYYYVRLMKSKLPEDQAVVQKVGFVWPNQSSTGTHINVSGAGVLKNAPNREAAVRFIEYLLSDEAQSYLANGNNEWPVVSTVKLDNPELANLGKFKADKLPVGTIGKSQVAAQRMLDRVGWR